MSSVGGSRRQGFTSPWLNEFREQLSVIFGEPQRTVLDLAVFDALDGRLAQKGMSTDDIEKELYGGVFGAREITRDTDRRRYRLWTRRLEVTLHTERSRTRGGIEITVLDNAFARRERPSEWHVPVNPARVTLHHPSEAPPCDLEGLIDEVDRRRRLREAEHTLTRVRLTPRRHAELRAKVRRRYGSLRALFELARQQAKVGDKAAAHGRVIDGQAWFGPGHPSANELVVHLDGPAPFPVEEEAARLTIWPVDDPDSAETLDAAEIVDEIVVLSYPDKPRVAEKLRRRLPSGTRVVVSETGEFRYQRHSYALHTFMDEKTVGNWTALATLLCQPEDLAHPTHLPEIQSTTRPLNSEQQDAVAGAVTAPHAFLIQGPPGTGKTQVITDTASRLIGRGERVLLTAPTHVALDEVLRRLADEPGVLPLRLSWNDKYVARDVHRFTMSGYDSEVARMVRTPGTSKVAQWRERFRRLTAQRDAVEAWLKLPPQRDAAEQNLSTVRNTAASRAAMRLEQVRRHDAELERLRLAADHFAAQLTWIANEERVVRERRVTLERSRGRIGRFLDSIGVGAVARLSRREQRLGQQRTAASTQYSGAHQRHTQHHAAREHLVASLATDDHEDQNRVAAAQRHLEDLERQLRETSRALAELGLGDVQADHAAAVRTRQSLEDSQRGLEALLDVQLRWFETIGATGSNEAEDRQRALSVVRKALSSAANLICTTTVGFGGAMTFRDLDYDTLIVDEASKVTVAEFLIPALRARRWVLVGDEKQLTPYVDSTVEHHIHAMAAIHLSERDRQYSLDAAVKHLATLWRTLDDDEQHPFRISSVEKIAHRLLSNGTWASAHRRLYARQLKHVTAGTSAPEGRLLGAMHEHLVASLFERCVAEVDADTGPRCQLVEQRRMTPEIAELVRVPVYGGDYRSPPADDPEVPRPLLSPSFRAPIVLLDTSTQSWPWDDLPPNTTSFINELEANWVVDVCQRWNADLAHLGVPDRTSISVLAFYGAQARLIRHKLGHPRYARFPKLDFKVVDSIDRIQGQQSDIVVISFCRTFGRPKDRTKRPPSNPAPPPAKWAPWLQNINRLNVACTRARRSLVLVGHRRTLSGLNGMKAARGFYDNLFRLPPSALEVNVDWSAPRNRKRP